MEENNEEMISSNIFYEICRNNNPANEPLENLSESTSFDLDTDFLKEVSSYDNQDNDFVADSLEYVAGYIAKKLKLDNYIEKENQKSSYTWVDEISRGGLKKPSKEFLDKIIELNNIFNIINKDKLCVRKDYLKYHVDLSEKINLSNEIKILFFRIRMYFRIRILNKNLDKNICTNRKKLKKTYS